MIELEKNELVYDIKNTAFSFADSYSKQKGIDAKQLKNKDFQTNRQRIDI